MSFNWDRICYVVPSMGVGGSERQLLRLMRGLSLDHELLVIGTRTDGALAGDARRLGDMRVLHARGGWDPRIRFGLERYFHAYRPAIVHSLMFGFDYPANVAARRAGIPVVISSRRQLAHWKKPRHIRLQKRANKLVDCIIANSRAVADFAIEQEDADPSLFRVIYNGVDVERFRSRGDHNLVRRRYNIPFHTHVVGMVANFSDEKDHALFVRIAEETLRRRPDVHFVLVGTGPLRAEIAKALLDRKLEDQVTMIRTVSELPDLYELMTVFLLCSKSEGFPNVILEAMVTGTPVVAAAVGGIPEIVEDKVTGRLVGTRDPADFADAIEYLIGHPAEAKAMGRHAANMVEQEFSVDQMVDSYKTLYRELLQAARKRGRAG